MKIYAKNFIYHFANSISKKKKGDTLRSSRSVVCSPRILMREDQYSLRKLQVSLRDAGDNYPGNPFDLFVVGVRMPSTGLGCKIFINRTGTFSHSLLLTRNYTSLKKNG